MELFISDTFTKALSKLDNQSQALVKQQAFDFHVNPANPGFKFHRINKSKEKNFWSFRVSQDIRIIVYKTNDKFVLCYTDHHDNAYDWAVRRRMSEHPKTGAAQIIEISERTEEIVRKVTVDEAIEPFIFQKYEAEYLLALGVPVEWIEAIRHVTEDQFFELAEKLPEEAAERLLELASGNPVPVPPLITPDSAFTHPDAQRRFRVVTGQDELGQALEYPWERWLVFLHPLQQSAVDRDLSGPGRVCGSAGTGKTVVAIHRAARLAKNDPNARVFLTTYSKTLAIRLGIQMDLLSGSNSGVRKRIEVGHLHKKALEIWSHHSARRFIAITRPKLNRIIEDANSAIGGGAFSDAFVRSEWEAIIDMYNLRKSYT